MNDFSLINDLLVVTPTVAQSAESEFFDRMDEDELVTIERGNVHVRTVNFVYPDGRVVTRTENIITSRRCDSVVNININSRRNSK